MNSNTYQRRALATEHTPDFLAEVPGRDEKATHYVAQLQHAQLGIASEGGELAGAIKKHLIYGQPLDETNVLEELGDVLWYVTLGAKAAGYTLEQVMEANLRKLAVRHGEAFNPDACTTRDLDAEHKALLGSVK